MKTLAPTDLLAEIAGKIRGHRFRYANEGDLQLLIFELLTKAFAGTEVRVDREVKLDADNRIDLMVGGVGIEVKVKGKPKSVALQLARYAEFDQVEGLLLVTTHMRHLSTVLPVVDGEPAKPVGLVCLAGAGL